MIKKVLTMAMVVVILFTVTGGQVKAATAVKEIIGKYTYTGAPQSPSNVTFQGDLPSDWGSAVSYTYGSNVVVDKAAKKINFKSTNYTTSVERGNVAATFPSQYATCGQVQDSNGNWDCQSTVVTASLDPSNSYTYPYNNWFINVRDGRNNSILYDGKADYVSMATGGGVLYVGHNLQWQADYRDHYYLTVSSAEPVNVVTGVLGVTYIVNEAPTISLWKTSGPITINGSGSIAFQGTVNDVNGDTLRISATLAGVTKVQVSSGGVFTFIWPASQIPEGRYTNTDIVFTVEEL